jgi:O-methyltransferase
VADQVEATPELLSYVRQVSLREDEILRELRAETALRPAGRALQVMAEGSAAAVGNGHHPQLEH